MNNEVVLFYLVAERSQILNGPSPHRTYIQINKWLEKYFWAKLKLKKRKSYQESWSEEAHECFVCAGWSQTKQQIEFRIVVTKYTKWFGDPGYCDVTKFLILILYLV